MIADNSSGEVLGLRFGRPDPAPLAPPAEALPAPPEPTPVVNPAIDRLACALQPLVERLLLLICERSDGQEPSSERVELGQRLAGLSRSLIDASDRQQRAELAEPILDICSRLLTTPPRSASHAEIVAAITMVRDAVASIDGVEQTLQKSLSESADKFDALRQLDNIQQLKAGLARQVDNLRQVSSKREQQWRRQMASVQRKIRTLETQLEETRLEARHDPLTGLVNRKGVESSFRIFQESRRAFVMALLDLDDFKLINDTFGHLAGDQALKAVAATLQSSLRSHDVIGRFGGDEFIVIMVDVSLALAERRLVSVLQNLRNMPPVVDKAPKISVSCGAAEQVESDTFEALMARADEALYDAKRSGKNRLGISATPARPIVQARRA